MERLTIYTSDIVAITGKSERTAQRIRQTIKDALQRKKHQDITFSEFCNYFGYSTSETENFLNQRQKRH